MTVAHQPNPGAITMFNEEDIKTIREAYGKQATESEFKVFINICEQTRLNPFTKQIYFIKTKGGMTTMTSIDGLRLIAERTGKYVPGKETAFAYDNNGNLLSATAYVKKYGPDKTWHEVAATAFMKEYKGYGVWDSKPHVMLSKCAESLALRKAFPSDLSGLYSEDEMDKVVSDPSPNYEAPKLRVKQLDLDSYINEEQVKVIEDNISPEDKEYRSTLLEYFGNGVPLPDFTKLKLEKFDSLMNAIMKRKAKMQPVEMPETAEF